MHSSCNSSVFVRWNSGPIEEDVAPVMDQKAFTSHLVKCLCGDHSFWKQRRQPSLSSSTLTLPSSGHESVNIVKSGKMKKGRCAECFTGQNKKRARVGTVYGCQQCEVCLCRDKCHDLYYSRLALPHQ